MKKLGKIFLTMAFIMAMCLGNTMAVTIEGDTYEEPSNVIEVVSIYKNQKQNDKVVYIEHQKWGSIGYSDENTIIGGTAAKWSMRTDGENNQITFKMRQFDEEGNATLVPYDISGLKETGYLRMLVYPKTELTAFAGNVDLLLYSGPESGAAKDSRVVSVKEELKMNKWNLVKVPVASFVNDKIDLTNVSRIIFRSFGAYAADTMTYYIQNVGFCDEAGLNISTAEYTDGSVNLSWTPKTITPAQYSVKCNGEEIAKTAEQTYSYAPSQKGCINEYTVDALDENGAVICTSAAKSLYIDDPKTITVASVYKNSKPDTLTIFTLSNYGYPEYTDENTVIGGKSIKWSMRAEEGNQLKMELNPTIDASAAVDSGYLTMLVYPKTELETLPGNISAFYYGNGKDTNVVSISDQLTMNKWNLVKIPVETLIKNRATDLDSSKINQVWLRATGEYEANALTLYVQNIAFCTESSVGITSAKYNNGKVTLNWQSNAAAASYVVKCNGELVGTYKNTLAIITPKKYGTVAAYTVEALDAAGNVIAESDERMLFIENKNDIADKKVTVFENTLPSDLTISTLPNYGGYNKYSETTPLSGDAMMLSVYGKETIANRGWANVNGFKIEISAGKDISETAVGGYLRMLVYPKTELEAFPGHINTAIYSGTNQSNVIYIDDKLEMNKWNTVVVPLADLLNDTNLDVSKITQIAINAMGDYENDGDCEFYVQGIEFGITEGVFANEIKAEENGNNVTFTANVRNLTSADAAPVMIAAAYNEDGSLAKEEMFNTKTIGANAEDVVSGTFEVSENTTYKAMLVSDISSMKPLTKAAEKAN